MFGWVNLLEGILHVCWCTVSLSLLKITEIIVERNLGNIKWSLITAPSSVQEGVPAAKLFIAELTHSSEKFLGLKINLQAYAHGKIRQKFEVRHNDNHFTPIFQVYLC